MNLFIKSLKGKEIYKEPLYYVHTAEGKEKREIFISFDVFVNYFDIKQRTSTLNKFNETDKLIKKKLTFISFNAFINFIHGKKDISTEIYILFINAFKDTNIINSYNNSSESDSESEEESDEDDEKKAVVEKKISMKKHKITAKKTYLMRSIIPVYENVYKWTLTNEINESFLFETPLYKSIDFKELRKHVATGIVENNALPVADIWHADIKKKNEDLLILFIHASNGNMDTVTVDNILIKMKN